MIPKNFSSEKREQRRSTFIILLGRYHKVTPLLQNVVSKSYLQFVSAVFLIKSVDSALNVKALE